jgi:hypothetical protein
MVLITGVIGLLIAMLGFAPQHGVWRSATTSLHVLATIVHEAGHAAATVVTGGDVHRIEVHTPRSGATRFSRNSWLSAIVRSAAGYAAPPLAGLGMAALLNRGQAHTVLVLTVAAMVLVLPVSRGWRTIAAVLAIGWVAFAALYWGSAQIQQLVAYTETWLLLLCELAGLWQLVRIRTHGDDPQDDARSLANKTLIPSPIWILGWYALNAWALWTAVPLLWP